MSPGCFAVEGSQPISLCCLITEMSLFDLLVNSGLGSHSYVAHSLLSVSQLDVGFIPCFKINMLDKKGTRRLYASGCIA